LISNIVARRYAKALFALGLEQGGAELEAYGEGLAAFAQALAAAPEMMRVFKNPIFSAAEKKAVADKVLAQLGVNLSATLRNFIHLLADKNRLAFAADIEATFKVLLDAHKGLLRGRLLTAAPISPAKQEAVKGQLTAQLGKELVLDFDTDPAILGGVVLKVGDKILDASLRAQLQNMKEIIKRGE
jgi:F-type H+-transporting ATPase subunit delta